MSKWTSTILVGFMAGVVALSIYLLTDGFDERNSGFGGSNSSSTNAAGSRSGEINPGVVEPGPGRPFMAMFDPDEPLFLFGNEVDKQALSTRAPYEVVEPQWFPPEMDSDEGEFWFAGATDEAGIRYGAELVLGFREWPKERDPAAAYESQASDWKVGYTTKVNDWPAWIIPADARGPDQPPVNTIRLTRKNAGIAFFGKMSMEDLQKTAESLPE